MNVPLYMKFGGDDSPVLSTPRRSLEQSELSPAPAYMMYSQWSGHGLPRSTGHPAHKFDPYVGGYKDKVTVFEEHFPVKSCSSHSGRNSKGLTLQERDNNGCCCAIWSVLLIILVFCAIVAVIVVIHFKIKYTNTNNHVR